MDLSSKQFHISLLKIISNFRCSYSIVFKCHPSHAYCCYRWIKFHTILLLLRIDMPFNDDCCHIFIYQKNRLYKDENVRKNAQEEVILKHICYNNLNYLIFNI